ncbi:glucosamine-6-phosphate deaminase [Pacificibacter sp. AS14]|uniref:glucosamine-6-phosphate deaminase n=1 Tax=Pacificibacter sp. AS14 TaxID=3135785 RepID=UPI00317B0EA7
MNFTVFDTPNAAEIYAAELIAAQVQLQPESVIGWATGGTMLGLYDALRRMDVSFKQTRGFNLDEYVGLGPDHPQSYHHYMRNHFFDHIDIAADHIHLPSGLGNPQESAAQYERLLAQYGPIDLQLLGIGQNGHIGFNEPGAAFDGGTQVTALSDTTIAANSRFFDDKTQVPKDAVTMGIGAILKARKIVLLACGSVKADAVKAMAEGPIGRFCPASSLRGHPNVAVVLDQAAAAHLSL